MGPRLGSRGKLARVENTANFTTASMGPRLGSRGKLLRVWAWFDQQTQASMGPRLGSRGKIEPKVAEVFRALLQWGRDLEVAESVRVNTLKADTEFQLQWGRDLEVAERSHSSRFDALG